MNHGRSQCLKTRVLPGRGLRQELTRKVPWAPIVYFSWGTKLGALHDTEGMPSVEVRACPFNSTSSCSDAFRAHHGADVHRVGTVRAQGFRPFTTRPSLRIVGNFNPDQQEKAG